MSYPFTHNTRLEENKIFKLIDYIYSEQGKSVYFNPLYFHTSTFSPLLDLIDDSDTKNEVSFIPYDFLVAKYGKEPVLNSEDIIDELDTEETKKIIIKNNNRKRKEFLLSQINVDGILEEEYKGIKLKLLKKPILSATINSDIPFDKLNTNDDLDKENGNFINKFKKYSNNVKSDWLSNINVDETLDRFVHINRDLKVYHHRTFFVSSRTLLALVKEVYEEYKYLKEIINDYDIFILPVGYYSHFTVYIIDMRLKLITHFNSNGHVIQDIKLNNGIDHFFLDPNLKGKYYKTTVNENEFNISSLFYINYAINEACKNIFNITCAIYNDFTYQRSNGECGIFILVFCYAYIVLNPQSKQNLKLIYHSLFYKGDNTMACIRSCLFFSLEDMAYHNLTEYGYNKDLSIYMNINKFFIGYFKNYIERYREIKKINRKFKKLFKSYVIETILNPEYFDQQTSIDYKHIS